MLAGLADGNIAARRTSAGVSNPYAVIPAMHVSMLALRKNLLFLLLQLPHFRKAALEFK